MQRNMLLGLLLSTTVTTYAQDSLSIPKPVTDTSGTPKSENNIRYVQFQKSRYGTTGFPVTTEAAGEPELTISEYTPTALTSNWFVNTAIGASAFLGSPLGCEDLFGRIRPIYHLSFGKWFSPTAGGRIAFQGFDLKNHLIERQDYYHLHADFLWNVTNLFRKDNSEARWQFIPFAGTGIIQNNASHQHLFTLNYGILNHLRLTDRLSLSLELGGLTTFSNFDGTGCRNQFSDHLLHLSAGVSITLGNKGWNFRQKRFNDLLTQYNHLFEANKRLERENGQNSQIMAQMRRIFEIEGLLSRLQDDLEQSGLSLPDDTTFIDNSFCYPKNDYSGLNSLRKRLSTTAKDITENTPDNISDIANLLSGGEVFLWTATDNDTSATAQDSLSGNSLPEDSLNNTPGMNRKNYFTDMINQKACIGSPILFFFHIGTATLTDSSQLANIDEIARICKKYGLLLKVTGYADSATGDTTGNILLSNQRATYIASELEQRNISGKTIKIAGKGGIDTYSPDKVNRCVKIELHLKQ